MKIDHSIKKILDNQWLIKIFLGKKDKAFMDKFLIKIFLSKDKALRDKFHLENQECLIHHLWIRVNKKNRGLVQYKAVLQINIRITNNNRWV